jgi:hypothetical protein
MAIGFERGGAALAVAILLCSPCTTSAQAPDISTSASLIPPPKAPGPEQLALSKDVVHRLTIPVMVDGQGPFPFVIDTGADRTVISKTLAATLKLPSGPDVELHSSGGVDQVSTAAIASLGVGKRTVSDVDAPMLDAVDLDAQGMLGIDSLRDQHVVMDFRTGQMTSSPSRAEPYDPNTIVVHGKSRFGQLILVDAQVRGIRVYVILDSGAEVTVGNDVLRELLTHGDVEHGQPTQVISVTGRRTPGEFQEVEEAHIGGLTIRNMPLTFAELHTFARFGLTDKPAMLLGMDVLRMCRRVSVDFKRREASFTLDPGGPT